MIGDHELIDSCAFGTLDQDLDRVVGQLQQLQDRRERSHVVEVSGLRVVEIGALLRDEQYALTRRHGAVERDDRLVAADKQRNDHVRIHDDVAQRQDRNACSAGIFVGRFDHIFFRHEKYLVRDCGRDAVMRREFKSPTGPVGRRSSPAGTRGPRPLLLFKVDGRRLVRLVNHIRFGLTRDDGLVNDNLLRVRR